MKCWLSYVKISYGPVFWHTDCQIATVAMETTEQVLSQLKIFLMQWLQNWIRSLSAKIMSECCELAKLCHINHSGPVFLRQCSATSNNTKLLHWPLMGGLLHLVQRGGTGRGHSLPRPLLAVPNVTARLSTASVPITILLYAQRRSAVIMGTLN